MKSKGEANVYADGVFIGEARNVEININKAKVGYVGGGFNTTAEVVIKDTKKKQSAAAKCSKCSFKILEEYSGSPSRYYCTHPKAVAGRGSKMICRCSRGSNELTIKTSPKWCPTREG